MVLPLPKLIIIQFKAIPGRTQGRWDGESPPKMREHSEIDSTLSAVRRADLDRMLWTARPIPPALRFWRLDSIESDCMVIQEEAGAHLGFRILI